MHPMMKAFRDGTGAGLDQDILAALRADAAPDPQPFAISRRGVLLGGASAGLIVAIGGFAPREAQAAALGVEGKPLGLFEPNQFVGVGPDNIVTIMCKHQIGRAHV